MANITGSTSEKIFQLKAWGGLHENPDGDTKLKMGEAAVMRNFRVTRDGNLQRRPGTLTVAALSDGDAVKGLWTGYVHGEKQMLAACGGKLWRLYDAETDSLVQEEIGEIDCENDVHFFGFSDICYMLNGKEYKQWDGETLEDVHGYRPLVNISVAPDNTSREDLEQINKLCGERRMWISPDGEGKTFHIPEKHILSVDYVKDLASDELIDESNYTVNLEEGTVTFNEAPEDAINSLEIGWTMAETFRHEVLGMRYSEFYSGSQDTRVFLYGDGSNEAIYSEVDNDGLQRADYFPDMNEIKVGDANTPITAMIRQYSTLVCFKENSAWSIQFGTITLADGIQTAAFYCTPTNRSLGNEALGQVRLVLNAPYTLHGSDIYEWRNTGSYSSNLSRDERQAKRISDRIYATLREFDFSKCRCWDDNGAQEYYVCCGKRALVYNYAADAWYSYTNFDAHCMANLNEELYLGTSDGRINHFSYDYYSDNGEEIDAYWESGSMSFGQDYSRKYAAMLWVGIEPESNAEVEVTVMTDRKSSYTEKVVKSSLATFSAVNFGRWSFRVNRQPFMTKLKIKAKKFVFYKLIFKSKSAETTATVLAADIRVRFTGYAK